MGPPSPVECRGSIRTNLPNRDQRYASCMVSCAVQAVTVGINPRTSLCAHRFGVRTLTLCGFPTEVVCVVTERSRWHSGSPSDIRPAETARALTWPSEALATSRYMTVCPVVYADRLLDTALTHDLTTRLPGRPDLVCGFVPARSTPEVNRRSVTSRVRTSSKAGAAARRINDRTATIPSRGWPGRPQPLSRATCM